MAAVMFSIDLLRDLFAHMEWADATVWRAALLHPSASPDTRLRDLLLHIHVVQRAFLHVWTDRAVIIPNPDEFPDIAAVQRWAHPVYAELSEVLNTLDTPALARPLALPWVSEFEQRLGRPFSSFTLGDTMFQVASHSTYHRGQVNMRLRELGAEPPLVDFIAWVWFGKPQAEWQAMINL